MRPIQTTAGFGSAIRQARLDRRMTQAELATKAGVGRPWLSELESGKRRAELGRALMVLGALELAITLTPAPTPGPGQVDLRTILGEST